MDGELRVQVWRVYDDHGGHLVLAGNLDDVGGRLAALVDAEEVEP